MPNSTTKTKMVSFRLRVETWEKIENALRSPTNQNTSVSDYCRMVIERYAWRHDK